MKLSRTDLGPLAAVVASGALGVALFGPQTWVEDSVTVDVVTVDVVTDDAVRTDEPSFEWRSESGTEEHVFSEENVVIVRQTEGPAEPLVYVDGALLEVPAGSDVGAVVREIAPDGIERVEVIKGEAAEKLFGPEASAGVIQVFTREGAGSSAPAGNES